MKKEESILDKWLKGDIKLEEITEEEERVSYISYIIDILEEMNYKVELLVRISKFISILLGFWIIFLLFLHLTE